MSVELDPVELGFRRPFTREVAETLRLKNPSSDPVAFKVKTTAPKKYAVRPNSGKIEGGQVVEVQVLLQTMKEDPPEGDKCRDKFLVQSIALSADQDLSNITALWANIESTAKSSIQEKKIRVNWLSSSGAMPAETSTPGRNSLHQDDNSTVHGSPYVGAGTPQSNHTEPVGPADSINARPIGAKSTADAKADAGVPTTNGQQSTIGNAIASVASALPSSEDVKGQLADAQATIARLTKQVQDQGLRQRKPDLSSNEATERSSAASTKTSMQQAAPSGVPVPIAAALCLLSFLLAYFLF